MTEEIMYQKSYREYKAELDAELTKTAEGFVRIGYLLKVARDTDILKDSGYDNVNEFAKAEYGIDKTQVSRFIRINDKFSEGGYSDHLLPEYQGYGYAKLTLMLQLPDAINEGLSPAYSKSEIQAIKDEVEAEARITDIEVMMEEQDQKAAGEAAIRKLIYQIGEEDPEMFAELCDREGDYLQKVQETMAPQGEKTYSVRIPGMGRLMMMLNETGECRIVNSRTGEKETVTWEEIAEEWSVLCECADQTPQERYEKVYAIPYPQIKAEVAPVQQKAEAKKEKKDSKVSRAVVKNGKKEESKGRDESAVEADERESADCGCVAEGEDTGAEGQPEDAGSGECDEIIGESSREDTDHGETHQIAGYKAGITSSIRRMQDVLAEERWSAVISAAEDIKWRAQQIMRMKGEQV